MIEIEQGTGKYVTIAADEETALRWSRDIGFKMMQYNQIRDSPFSRRYFSPAAVARIVPSLTTSTSSSSCQCQGTGSVCKSSW